MKLSKEARKVAKQVFQASFEAGRISNDRVRAISTGLAAKKPRNYVGILKEFQRLLRLEIAKHHAIIEGATDLSPETVFHVTADLQNRYGSDLTTEFKTNPALLGGLRIRIGSDVFDGSVQGRLLQLEKSLSA